MWRRPPQITEAAKALTEECDVYEYAYDECAGQSLTVLMENKITAIV